MNISWVSRLHQTFAENGLQKVLVDRQPHSKESLTFLLDAFMVASEEISHNLLDKIGGGQGDVARGLIAEVAENRETTAFHLDRVTTIAQKPLI